ncbi:hypothetical protein SAMN05880582_11175 [Rhizobium sp. RU20A]|nr:hypothetical protein SAMN05880582_11175 [Rhizobium sp. RU20A]
MRMTAGIGGTLWDGEGRPICALADIGAFRVGQGSRSAGVGRSVLLHKHPDFMEIPERVVNIIEA